MSLYNLIDCVDFSFTDDLHADINCAFLRFINVITTAIDNSFPLKRKNGGSKESNRIPWFGEDAKRERETLRFLTSLRGRYPALVPPDLLRGHRARYRDTLLRGKREANCRHIDNASNTQKAVWEVIRNNGAGRVKPVSDKISADDFNAYFCSMAENLISTIPQIQKTTNPIYFADGITHFNFK